MRGLRQLDLQRLGVSGTRGLSDAELQLQALNLLVADAEVGELLFCLLAKAIEGVLGAVPLTCPS